MFSYSKVHDIAFSAAFELLLIYIFEKRGISVSGAIYSKVPLSRIPGGE